MSSGAHLPRPTDGELAILRILWADGPRTVRQVVDSLNGSRLRCGGKVDEVGYTTALKQMQIMHEKGLLARDDAARSHVYRPAVPQERTLRQLAGDLLDRAFAGSASKLLVSALGGKRATPVELAEIRRLLNELERK